MQICHEITGKQGRSAPSKKPIVRQYAGSSKECEAVAAHSSMIADAFSEKAAHHQRIFVSFIGQKADQIRSKQT